ncbi:hypothetical protein Hamer_G016259 [Homarus americanus]|uniref:Uncharacterized protein n=1 Tax=Homarus americanus TaxID=6706 RepID=A0A8J5JMS4_HOMAM|nr:hypothetical protein Hamer_G016259 [Homarus americanus]
MADAILPWVSYMNNKEKKVDSSLLLTTYTQQYLEIRTSDAEDGPVDGEDGSLEHQVNICAVLVVEEVTQVLFVGRGRWSSEFHLLPRPWFSVASPTQQSSTGAENDFSCPSAASTPSATALAGYSYSQGLTTPLGYLQYNLTYFSPVITRTAGPPLLPRGPSDLNFCYISQYYTHHVRLKMEPRFLRCGCIPAIMSHHQRRGDTGGGGGGAWCSRKW